MRVTRRLLPLPLKALMAVHSVSWSGRRAVKCASRQDTTDTLFITCVTLLYELFTGHASISYYIISNSLWWTMQPMILGKCHRLVNMSHILAIMSAPIIIINAGAMILATMKMRNYPNYIINPLKISYYENITSCPNS